MTNYLLNIPKLSFLWIACMLLGISVGSAQEEVYTYTFWCKSKTSHKPISGMRVFITDIKDGTIEEHTTNVEGKVLLHFLARHTYKVEFQHAYYFSTPPKNYFAERPIYEENIIFEQIIERRVYPLKGIEFEVNSDKILEETYYLLDQLFSKLLSNPNIRIEIGVHTDARGSDTYNQTLSYKRAESIVRYLMEKGIEQDRLVPKGYGESTLVNDCSNGVLCSNEEHARNRRVEWMIIEIW